MKVRSARIGSEDIEVFHGRVGYSREESRPVEWKQWYQLGGEKVLDKVKLNKTPTTWSFSIRSADENALRRPLLNAHWVPRYPR
jgi:hypothetical protein